jgi:hypothetical protein
MGYASFEVSKQKQKHYHLQLLDEIQRQSCVLQRLCVVFDDQIPIKKFSGFFFCVLKTIHVICQ